jgi:PadR family transcriptional regulator PadR
VDTGGFVPRGGGPGHKPEGAARHGARGTFSHRASQRGFRRGFEVLDRTPGATRASAGTKRPGLCKTFDRVSEPLRITDNVVAIFCTMLERPRKGWYGLEIAAAAGIGSATIYAALTRMERAGWLHASWEAEAPSDLGRPQRRLYKLTAAGATAGREAIASYQPRVRIPKPERGAGWLPGAQGAT